jgi:undecaprenyl-diphosphatase
MKEWIAAHDRALFLRLALTPASHATHRWGWLAVTHLGSVVGTVSAIAVPLWYGDREMQHYAWIACAALVLTFLFIQVVKRRATRDRPATPHEGPPLARFPDEFSFPSGHSGATMAIACAYALAYHVVAIPLVLLALLVGVSRVRLGVHYPLDVIVGQAIGVATAIGVWVLMR